MGLRAKFNLLIFAAFAVGFLIAAIVLDRVADDTARDQVLQNARIMMAAASARAASTKARIRRCGATAAAACRKARPLRCAMRWRMGAVFIVMSAASSC